MASIWSVAGRHSATSTQATTQAAPSDPLDGISLLEIDAVVAVLQAPNGQTFDGSGSLRAYRYSPILGIWLPAHRADEALADSAGEATASFPALPVVSRGGRLAFVCNGVGLSGGTQIRVTLLAYSLRDGGEV